MLLPQDERRLLVHYVRETPRSGEWVWYQKHEVLSPLLERNKKLDDLSEGFDRINRINCSNDVLVSRGMIETEPQNSDMNMVRVAVTSEGHKWGWKYRSNFGCVDAWYMEHKDGILGLAFALVAGIVGGFLSHWLIGD